MLDTVVLRADAAPDLPQLFLIHGTLLLCMVAFAIMPHFHAAGKDEIATARNVPPSGRKVPCRMALPAV